MARGPGRKGGQHRIEDDTALDRDKWLLMERTFISRANVLYYISDKSLEFDAIELHHVKASQSSEHPSAPVAAGAGVS